MQKPTVAAWAVNQVYWRQHKIFEALSAASRRVRAAHERRLAGKDADIDLAEAAHRKAVNVAVNAAADLLRGSGDAGAEATLRAVKETFQTLVWSSVDGRLVRPLKPTGVEAISALLKGPTPVARPRAAVLPIRPAVEDRVTAAKRDAQAAASAARTIERTLRSAERTEDRAAALVRRASAALDQAVRQQAKALTAAEHAADLVRKRREALQTLRDRAKTAAAERERLARRLSALGAPAD